MTQSSAIRCGLAPSAPLPESLSPAAKPTGLPWLQALLIAAICGAMFPLAYPTSDLYPLAFFVLAPLLFIAEEGRGRHALVCGLVAGFLTNGIGYRFLSIPMQQFAGFSAPLAALGVVLIAVYQGLRTGLWLYLLSVARRRAWPLWLAAPVFEVGLELVYPYIFISHHGSALYRFPQYIQIADLFGVYGVSAAVVLGNVLVYELARYWVGKRVPLNRKLLGGLLAVQILTIGYGCYRVKQVDATAAAAPSKRIALIQPSLGAKEKNTGLGHRLGQLDPMIQIERQIELSREVARSADLLLWPEVTYPALISRSADKLSTLPVHGDYEIPVLFGAHTGVRGARTESLTWNSALLVDKDKKIRGRYDKNFLVWFSESLPFSDVLPILDRLFPKSAPFTRGTDVAVIPWDGFHIAPSICNDDIIPAYTLRLGDKPTNLLVNLTNDAWFGESAEPYFHQSLAIFRAVESHLYLVRDTNAGVSSLIDAAGRIVEETPVTVNSREPLARAWEVRMMPAQPTPYRRVGNHFAYLCLALAAMTIVLRRPSMTTSPLVRTPSP